MTGENRLIADMALFGFIKIVAKISKYTHILEYNRLHELKQRMPNYCVGMGFGLHQGWAIEGTIGSHYKIDASYLSPNVNMANRLEALTKSYDCKILLSEPMYDVFSESVQSITREIDTVFLKGTHKPMKLYTVDLFPNSCVEQVDDLLFKPIKEKKRLQELSRKKLWVN